MGLIWLGAQWGRGLEVGMSWKSAGEREEDSMSGVWAWGVQGLWT